MKKSEKIQIKLNFDTSVIALPATIIDFVDKAKKFDIKVLLTLASSEKFREGKYIAKIAGALSSEEKDVESAIAFWNGTGLIGLSAEDASPKEKKPANDEPKTHTKRAKVSELPQYTTDELNSLLEQKKNILALIDECQNILGKIFTVSEIKILVALIDYLSLDDDYILVLMHHCARNEIKSIRTVEKMAISCYDEGFTEANVLQDALRAKDAFKEAQGRIRTMFGIGSRSLTSKEKKHIDTWLNTYKFSIELIEKAYEITINATTNPSLNYANAILERWYGEGIKSVAEVEAAMEKRALEKGGENSSFNVDDFFDAALKRSYSTK